MTEMKTAVDNYQSWTKQMLGNEQGRNVIGEQMEKAWTAEDKFVGELHDYVEGWCERRHAAAQAAIDYAHKFANGADQSEITKAWSDLTSATMKRFSEDAQAQFGFMQKMATSLSPLMGASALMGLGAVASPGEETASSNGETKSEKK